MPILTKSAVTKGSPAAFTLDKASLVPLITDAYFQDTANWKRIALVYESTAGKQKEKVIFDATQASPTSNFLISEKARDVFEIKLIMIYDFDEGFYKIPRASLSPAEFDVDLAAPVALIEQLQNGFDYAGLSSTAVALGQQVVPTSNYSVSAVQFSGRADEDVSSRQYFARIMDDNRNLIATSQMLDVSVLSTVNEVVWMSFNFDSPVSLSSGVTYRIEVYTTGGTGQTTIMGANYNSNVYPDGYYYNTNSPFAPGNPNSDLAFKVLGSAA